MLPPPYVHDFQLMMKIHAYVPLFRSDASQMLIAQFGYTIV